MACSFANICHTPCGDTVRGVKGSNEQLSKCDKNIENYLKFLKIPTSVTTEVSLILARIGDFSGDSKKLIICPVHRSSLGIGWKRTADKCQVPNEIAAHRGDRMAPKGDRGLGYLQSKTILESSRVLVPIGSAICRRCREGPMAESSIAKSHEKLSPEGATAAEVSDDFAKLTIDDPEPFDEPEHTTRQEKDTSVWEPNGSSASSSDETNGSSTVDNSDRQRTFLLQFLASTGQENINILSTGWEEAKYSTKRKHIVQASKAVNAVLNVLAPNDGGNVWKELQVSSMVNAYLDIGNFNILEFELIKSLVECYKTATSWDTRRQFLSIMAEKVTFEQLQKLIPGLSPYKLEVARRHAVKYGAGAEVKPTHTPRVRIDPSKLDHFVSFITSDVIIRDMPFGEKRLKLSTGEELLIPNMIRMMIPNRICKQYVQFCEETGFTPMGKRTMLKILEECKASLRTSLQGLDYFVVNGVEAFNQLHQVVEKLVTFGESQTWGREQIEHLKSSKQYIQSDYKVHVSESSAIGDHCSTYALSDSTAMECFGETCDHTHDQICTRCQEVSDVISNIEEGLNNVSVSSAAERDDLAYTVATAKEDILALKAHQLRLVNQDKAKANAMDHLDDSTVFIVQDWAMKFVPAKYRESQTDWFGKRGIPWHVCVILRVQDGVQESETLLHVFDPTTQDSSAVTSIMKHTIQVCKTDMPSLKDIYYMSDNAGCYHCSSTVQAVLDISEKTGVKVRQLDFTEAQGGKGICDRKAAMVKNHIRIYVNEGNDVDTAEHFRRAVESHGGVPGVKAYVCKVESKVTVSSPIENVKLFNNFKFTDAGILVCRAYGIGRGKLLKHDEAVVPPPIIISGEPVQSRFVPVKPRRPKGTSEKEDRGIEVLTDEESNLEEPHDSLFSCPEEGCIKTYRYYKRLQHHLMFGQHVRAPDRETLHDTVKVMYAEKISSYQTAPISSAPEAATAIPRDHTDRNSLSPGWALPSKKTVSRFNAKQKAFLNRKFDEGEQSGSKSDPGLVSKEMRFAKDNNGQILFTIAEFLSAKQIASYFSRTSLKVRGGTAQIAGLQEDTQMTIRARENHSNLCLEAMSTVGLKHPIMSHSYNICSLVANGRLKDLSLPVLKMVCHALEVGDIQDKRKKIAFQRQLEKLVDSCSCQI